jgi:DNA topoisomerase-1
MAVGLLSLPRLLGVHPETGGKIKASLGRFGPYVVHEYKDEEEKKQKKDYRSLKVDDDILTVSFERAMELLAQPKRSRSGGGSKKPLRELGAHPEDNEPVNVYKGPYGNYVKHGKVNAGLPEGETVESITLETAVKLLAEKAGAKKTKSKSTRKKSTKKTSN